MFSFPAWVAQTWCLQQSTFKQEAHCHPCHGEDRSRAQGLSGAHGQAAVVLTCTIHVSWQRAQRKSRTARCRFEVPKQRSHLQEDTQSDHGLTRAPRTQFVLHSAGRKQRAESSELSALEMCSHLCRMPSPRRALWAAQRGSHRAECAGATCASPLLGRWPRSGDFVKMVLIIFSIKHLSVQPVVSLAICGRIAISWGGGDVRQQDVSLLSCTFPVNERDCGQTEKLLSSPPLPQPHTTQHSPIGYIPAPHPSPTHQGHQRRTRGSVC